MIQDAALQLVELLFLSLIRGSSAGHLRLTEAAVGVSREQMISTAASGQSDHPCFLLMLPVTPDGTFIPSHLLTSIAKQLVLILFMVLLHNSVLSPSRQRGLWW